MISKKRIKILTLILIFTILINFTFEYKSYSEAITISAGLYAFLKAAYAAGLTYIAGQTITKVTKESIELYEEWQKFINNKPPEEKPPTDWEKTAILTLLGLQIGDTFKNIVDSVKEFFQELGAIEGENETVGLYTEVEKYDNQQDVIKEYRGDFDKGFTVALSVAGYGMVYTQYPGGEGYKCIFTGGEVYEKKGGGASSVRLEVEFKSEHVRLYFYNYVDQHVVYVPYESDITPIEIPEVIEYTFENNSYQFTGNPDDIKPVSPNLSVLPKDKITEENGKLIYNGTIDELVDDIINNADSENLFDTNSKQLEEIEPGKIVIGEAGTDPQPEPEPQPDPQPEPEPIEDTEVVGLLQTIINLLKNIADIPNKLFELPDNLDLDFSAFEGADLREKFPWCIPFDLKDSFSAFAQQAKNPSFDIDLDTQYFSIHHTIDYSFMTFFIGFFRYACIVFFSVFLMSKTRDLIKW